MRKMNNILFFLLILTMLFGVTDISAQTNNNNDNNLSEIKNLISKYFETRYQARKTNTIPDLTAYIDTNSKEMISEIDKLNLENYVNQRNNIFFASYSYELQFADFSIDKLKKNSTITVIESHDVIYNVSLEINKNAPIISQLSNLEHKIELVKIDDHWKINSDHYIDHVWKFIFGTSASQNELISIIDRNIAENKNQVQSKTNPSCNLIYDNTSHEYNRDGVVNYAEKWALDRNSAYANFGGDDCTNFISQAIHEGSTAGMSDEGGSGWYYYDITDRGTAWTWVPDFYTFVTRPFERDYFYHAGPEGCELNNKMDLRSGDVVQFQFPNAPTTLWDHAVIITGGGYWGPDYYYFYSAHSNDCKDCLLESVYYDEIRYIRIERIDGELKQVFVPMLIRSPFTTAVATKPQSTETPLNLAYPVPNSPTQVPPSDISRQAYP